MRGFSQGFSLSLSQAVTSTIAIKRVIPFSCWLFYISDANNCRKMLRYKQNYLPIKLLYFFKQKQIHRKMVTITAHIGAAGIGA